jgi:hypothetical protein
MADTALILAKNLSHTFYQKLYNHDRPDEWFVSVTKAFLKALQQERLAQASLVRIYATVRHFAGWLHRKFPALFPLGCPTEGVKPPAEPMATGRASLGWKSCGCSMRCRRCGYAGEQARTMAWAIMRCSRCCSAQACGSRKC